MHLVGILAGDLYKSGIAIIPLINIAFFLITPSGPTQLSISVTVKVYCESQSRSHGSAEGDLQFGLSPKECWSPNQY